jgi:hypothetical protein
VRTHLRDRLLPDRHPLLPCFALATVRKMWADLQLSARRMDAAEVEEPTEELEREKDAHARSVPRRGAKQQRQARDEPRRLERHSGGDARAMRTLR